MLEDFKIILPELCVVIILLVGQLAALFSHNKKIIFRFYIITLGLLILTIFRSQPNIDLAFNNSFILNPSEKFLKIIILMLSTLLIIFYNSYCDIKKVNFAAEFVTLLLLSVVGMMILISAHNFVLWFCALELQALTSYVLASFNLGSHKSSEAGIKYFILGALLSCIGAFGISFIYGFSGTLNLQNVYTFMQDNPFNIGLALGSIFVLICILFKLSAVPFHFWTPDVYEGSPTTSLAYFATIPKFGFIIVLINFLIYFVNFKSFILLKLLKISAILSMLLGAFGAIKQKSFKRLLAYSAILNTGYSLIGLCTFSTKGHDAAIINMLIYSISIMGLFSCLLACRAEKIDDLTTDDIQGLGTHKKAIAAGITIIMFSLIGLPPLAGFFGKYYLFYNAISNGEYLLAFVGILTSLIAAFYYLNIIKNLYFTANSTIFEKIPTNRGLLFISTMSISFILFYSMKGL